ncbi:N-acyl homoserine lactonase family protein (plasmid) [Paraburkholderia sprentiae WSM5005]|uniref:N-acyl homoserine lactonase family protein n=1 Tax=Paraburkholderia sprentiae WSM5005 TaxID=754502 RepID=A0A1I9YWV1_9BURK|nr:N-acyl homoserine lactonase family protein [Paraburkholderia sprentiae]APA90639.1 N-acyl homoserine lactonase family protein [Paraburkholderia sprentiae WSM5005]
MTQVLRVWPLLSAMHRYDKSISTRNRGIGTDIDAPILAYLIETRNGRVLYDVGCDYRKIADPALRERYYECGAAPMPAPQMTEEQRIPNHLARLGLQPSDIDVVMIGHLHFDHAGGLCEVCGSDIHVHADELEAARAQADLAYFQDDFIGDYRWRTQRDEYDVAPGVRTINTPGHTAGHMSLWIELPRGRPVILAGDAADLTENIDEEVAPGVCWNDREDLALTSIRKLKALAAESGATIWPNHDIAFWHTLARGPAWCA